MKQFKKICKKFNIFVPTYPVSRRVLNLFVKNIMFEAVNNEEFLLYGQYFQFVKPNYELMKKNYLLSIEDGNSAAMNNLGIYYFDIEKKYHLAKM